MGLFIPKISKTFIAFNFFNNTQFPKYNSKIFKTFLFLSNKEKNSNWTSLFQKFQKLSSIIHNFQNRIQKISKPFFFFPTRRGTRILGLSIPKISTVLSVFPIIHNFQNTIPKLQTSFFFFSTKKGTQSGYLYSKNSKNFKNFPNKLQPRPQFFQ